MRALHIITFPSEPLCINDKRFRFPFTEADIKRDCESVYAELIFERLLNSFDFARKMQIVQSHPQSNMNHSIELRHSEAMPSQKAFLSVETCHLHHQPSTTTLNRRKPPHILPPRYLHLSVLNETDILTLLAEALTADVETVFSDETGFVCADTAIGRYC